MRDTADDKDFLISMRSSVHKMWRTERLLTNRGKRSIDGLKEGSTHVAIRVT